MTNETNAPVIRPWMTFLMNIAGAFATISVGIMAAFQAVILQRLLTQSNLQVANIQSTTALQQTAKQVSGQIKTTEMTNQSALTVAEFNAGMQRWQTNTNNALTRDTKRSDISLRLVEVAVDILKADPTSKNVGLKQWAIGVINSNSKVQFKVPLSERAQQELQTHSLDGVSRPAATPPPIGLTRLTLASKVVHTLP